MPQSQSKCIIVDILKSMYGINIVGIQNVFEIKKLSYSMRDSSNMVQPKRNWISLGLRSFSYVWSKLWNDLPSYLTKRLSLSLLRASCSIGVIQT